MDHLPISEVKGYQIFSHVAEGRCIPFDLFGFEWMIELLHELIYLRRMIDGYFCLLHFDSSLVIKVARSRSNSRSRTFRVSEAACSNSFEASSKRPSFARRSARTLGRR